MRSNGGAVRKGMHGEPSSYGRDPKKRAARCCGLKRGGSNSSKAIRQILFAQPLLVFEDLLRVAAQFA